MQAVEAGLQRLINSLGAAQQALADQCRHGQQDARIRHALHRLEVRRRLAQLALTGKQALVDAFDRSAGTLRLCGIAFRSLRAVYRPLWRQPSRSGRNRRMKDRKRSGDIGQSREAAPKRGGAGWAVALAPRHSLGGVWSLAPRFKLIQVRLELAEILGAQAAHTLFRRQAA
jgi:hypothetical protein